MQHGPGTENAYGGVAQAFGESIPIAGPARRLPAPHRACARPTSTPPPHAGSHQVAEPIDLPARSRQHHAPRLHPAAQRPRRAGAGRGSRRLYRRGACPSRSTTSRCRATRYGPDRAASSAAAAVLVEAKRPVIYAGQGVHWAEAWAELHELAELLGAPVTTSLEGKSAFPENHPLALGSGGARCRRPCGTSSTRPT